MSAPDGPIISLVVAQGRNGVIGVNGGLPWRQRTDLRHFRTVTRGKPVVMGRKTWCSLPSALPDRDNIVLTRDRTFRAAGGWTFGALDVALACAGSRATARGVDEICVIGGEDIFRQALPLAQLIRLTVIDAEPEGDARFPDIGGGWAETERRDAPPGDGDDFPMRFITLARRRSAAD